MHDGDGWACVKWDKTGGDNVYRIDPEHDLVYADGVAASAPTAPVGVFLVQNRAMLS